MPSASFHPLQDACFVGPRIRRIVLSPDVSPFVALKASRHDVVRRVFAAVLACDQVFCCALQALGLSLREGMQLGKPFPIVLPNGLLTVVAATLLTEESLLT